ncbi:MAG: hypothetical protein HZB51_26545 [Chloroflexi bacterium]|nr:hypothetical protein [Chloroflexota bacterium]
METERNSPYQGLVPFGEEDAPFFFGREKETRLIIANLFASPLTLLYGASGVGKSSVLRAGVVHQLREHDDILVVAFDNWLNNPVNDLKTMIASASRMVNTQSVSTTLPLNEYLSNLSSKLNRHIMVILDQFEEYFLCHPQEDEFADEFCKAVTQNDSPISFLISIRDDSIAKLDRFEGRISFLFDNNLRIEHLNPDGARDAIVKPLDEYNRRKDTESAASIESALIDAVLEQVMVRQVVSGNAEQIRPYSKELDSRIETPYLQLVMARLWAEEGQTDSKSLRLATFVRLGGARQIVSTHLDSVMKTLSPYEQEIAWRILDFLATPFGATAQSAENLAYWTKYKPIEIITLMNKLAEGKERIIRPVAPTPNRPNGYSYEIFHDAMVFAILEWRNQFYAKAEERGGLSMLELARKLLQLLDGLLFVRVVFLIVVLMFFSFAVGLWPGQQPAVEKNLLWFGIILFAAFVFVVFRRRKNEYFQPQLVVVRKSEAKLLRDATVARLQMMIVAGFVAFFLLEYFGYHDLVMQILDWMISKLMKLWNALTY